MIEINLGIEHRNSILNMLNSNIFKKTSNEQMTDYLKILSTSLKLVDLLDFTEEEIETHSIEKTNTSFIFNVESNVYKTFKIKVEDLKLLFDKIYFNIYNILDYDTLNYIFLNIKNKIYVTDTKEYKFTNYTELENIKYILRSLIGLNNDYGNDYTAWINKYLIPNNINVKTIKNVIMLIQYLSIDVDLYNEYNIKLIEEDGKMFFKTDADFEFVVNIPTQIITELEQTFTEIGLDLNTFTILKKTLGFYNEEK